MSILGAFIGGGLGLLGSRSAGRSAERAADTAGQAQLEAARIAAEEARFRPVGMTTRFGTSQFGFDEAGRLASAGYETSPDIRALQDRLANLYGSTLGQAEASGRMIEPLRGGAENLFALGSKFMPADANIQRSPEAMEFAGLLRGLGGQVTPTSYDPNAAAQRYFEEQQAILDPARQRQEERLGASVFGRGRAGLSVGSMGQPELFALSQSRGEQDRMLAAQARERARQELQQDIGIGTQLFGGALQAGVSDEELQRARMLENLRTGVGLFGSGAELLGQVPQLQVSSLAPFQTQFGLAQLLEQAGMQPLDIGAQLGGRTATAGAQAGEALLRGGLGAAQTGLQGNLASASLRAGAMQDFTRAIPGLFGGSSPVGLPAPISGPGSFGIPGIGAPTAMMPSASIYPVSGWGGTSSPLGYSYYGM
jgi:hypothetical protein